jgi:hypothetical protein
MSRIIYNDKDDRKNAIVPAVNFCKNILLATYFLLSGKKMSRHLLDYFKKIDKIPDYSHLKSSISSRFLKKQTCGYSLLGFFFFLSLLPTQLQGQCTLMECDGQSINVDECAASNISLNPNWEVLPNPPCSANFDWFNIDGSGVDVNLITSFNSGVAVDVIITDANDVMQTVITDGNGDLSVSVPPGTTIVDVDENDADYPNGYIQAEGDDSSSVLAVARMTIDAG